MYVPLTLFDYLNGHQKVSTEFAAMLGILVARVGLHFCFKGKSF